MRDGSGDLGYGDIEEELSDGVVSNLNEEEGLSVAELSSEWSDIDEDNVPQYNNDKDGQVLDEAGRRGIVRQMMELDSNQEDTVTVVRADPVDRKDRVRYDDREKRKMTEEEAERLRMEEQQALDDIEIARARLNSCAALKPNIQAVEGNEEEKDQEGERDQEEVEDILDNSMRIQEFSVEDVGKTLSRISELEKDRFAYNVEDVERILNSSPGF